MVLIWIRWTLWLRLTRVLLPEITMKFPRRRFLHLAAGATFLPIASQIVRAEEHPTSPFLAERLAAYADGLRFDDLDDATGERVKAHLIDSLRCGLAACDGKPLLT